MADRVEKWDAKRLIEWAYINKSYEGFTCRWCQMANDHKTDCFVAAALALPAPMADRVDLRQNIETILVNRRAWAKTLRARRFETEPREIEAFADELAAALALPAEPPQANEYPKPCGLCPGTIESREDTEWHGLGNCVDICEHCEGSGIDPKPKFITAEDAKELAKLDKRGVKWVQSAAGASATPAPSEVPHTLFVHECTVYIRLGARVYIARQTGAQDWEFELTSLSEIPFTKIEQKEFGA